jgi:hypothetical protein
LHDRGDGTGIVELLEPGPPVGKLNDGAFFEWKWRCFTAGMKRTGEDGLHKTSTTVVFYGCLPGGEGDEPGYRKAYTPDQGKVCKTSAFLAASGSYGDSKAESYL